MNSDIKNNLAKGSVAKKLAFFTLPFLLSNLVQALYNVADMLIVGNFSGAAAMSGVNNGGQITFVLTHIIVGLCMGATVLIGQYVGANNDDGLKKTLMTTLTLLFAAAVVITIVTLIFKNDFLRLIQTPEESFAESESYLTVTSIGLIFIFGYNAFGAILRGMGDSKRPLYFALAACVTNIILDLIFVAAFGWGTFGAAVATVISQALSMFLCIYYMKVSTFPFDFRLSSFKIYKNTLKMILKIGMPTCVQNGIVSISFLFIAGIVNTVGGTAGAAAAGAVLRFNSFAFMPTLAIGLSVGTMCAQNIGANRLDRAVKSCKIGILFSFIISGAIFVMSQLFPAQIVSVFGDDPEVIAYGVEYLRSLSYDYLVIPFVFCVNGLLIGGGHTVFTLVNSILSSILFRIPLCWFLGITLDWGLFGIGLGIPLAGAGVTLMIIGYLLTGRWKRNLVK